MYCVITCLCIMCYNPPGGSISLCIVVIDVDCVSGVRCDYLAGCNQCLGYHPPYCTEGKTYH